MFGKDFFVDTLFKYSVFFDQDCLMPMNKYEVFQHIYLELQDSIADYLMMRGLDYHASSKQYSLTDKEIDWDTVVEAVVTNARHKYGFNLKMHQHYVTVFKPLISPNHSFAANRLFFGFFCPIIMSPVVMMYFVSRMAFLNFMNGEGRSLDLIFEDTLKTYNAVLQYPLSGDLVSSMIESYQHDEFGIKADTDSWFTRMNVKDPRNKGFFWYNNVEENILSDSKKMLELGGDLYRYSYLSSKTLLVLVASYINAKRPIDTSILRWHILSLNYAMMIEMVKHGRLDYVGVGVPQLLMQCMANSVYMIGANNVTSKHFLQVEKVFGVQYITEEEDVQSLLEVCKRVTGYSYQDKPNFTKKFIANHKKIFELIKRPDSFKELKCSQSPFQIQ